MNFEELLDKNKNDVKEIILMFFNSIEFKQRIQSMEPEEIEESFCFMVGDFVRDKDDQRRGPDVQGRR